MIFLMLLAPCVPAALTPNGLEGETEPGRLGGYVRVSLLMLSGGAGLVAWLRLRRRRRDSIPAQYVVLAGVSMWERRWSQMVYWIGAATITFGVLGMRGWR